MSITENMLIVLLGPTASGKTEASIRLAEQLGTEILSADSRQFYREMNIGTAKPDKDQLSRVPHHFIGHLSISEQYNAARYEKDVLNFLPKLFVNRSYVVMAGGSGLYIDAVCKGIDEVPEPDPALRDNLRREFREKGLAHLQTMLKNLDPVYYSTVDLQNPSRILRALEVCMMTGEPFSSFRKNEEQKRDFRIMKFGIDLPRSLLYKRIGERVDRMMDQGLLEEVISLYPYRELNALNTVGYKELFDHLEGRSSLQEAVERIKTNTRRYAKRQMTWFKKDTSVIWLRHWEELPFFSAATP